MITSDINADFRRPARVRLPDYYRTQSREVMEAAARTGATLIQQGTSDAVSTSRYEFPGDLTHDRAYRTSGVI